MCESWDSIMAMGFNVEDIFITFNIHIKFPSAFKANNCLLSFVIEKRAERSKNPTSSCGENQWLIQAYKKACNTFNNT